MTTFLTASPHVEASRWHVNGDHPQDYATDHHGFDEGTFRTFTGEERRRRGWEGDVVRYYRHPEIDGESPCPHCSARMHDHGWIDEGGQGRVVCPGDWVITGRDGDHYPCRHDLFIATHRAADDTS